jgi:hypothetical protein
VCEILTSEMFANRGVRWVTAGWVGFITENLVMSQNRDWIIANYGDDNYHIAYNILSTAACFSVGYGFLKHGKVGGPSFARRGPILQLAGFGIQALGLIGISQLAPALQVPVAFGSQTDMPKPAGAGKIQVDEKLSKERKLYVRCPIDFRSKNPDGGIYGVERVTRHPMLWFLGISSLGSAITTVYATHAVMFSFPIIMAFIGSEHQDYRYRRGSGGILTAEMESKTSNIPFAAILSGKQSFSALLDEMKWTNAAVATLAAAGLALRRIR